MDLYKKIINKIFKKQSDDIQLRVAGISYSKITNIYVLILEEIIPNWKDITKPPDNIRRAIIIMNFFEAQVIALELEKIKPQFILIYDVFKDLSKVFKQLKFKKIVVEKPINDEIVTNLVCDNKNEDIINIKPSDSIALSLRLNIPIYIKDSLLTIINKRLIESFDIKHIDKLEDYNIEDLKKHLQDAIEKEDYEKASLIRDEIIRKHKEMEAK
jgi:bifunctional DNase/RNase